MKLLYLLVLVLFLSSVQAQQVFQGSPNKIKLKFKEKEDYDKTYLIVDLDSSKFYTVNADSKTFESRKLTQLVTEQTALPKTIAGYNTTPVNLNSSGLSGILGIAGSSTFFAAPDLYFPIPKKHTGIPELAMIQNNHIVLGAEIKMGFPGMADEQMPDSVADKMKVSITATKVTPQTIELAEFSIPNNFTLQQKKMFGDTMIDSVYTDSVSPVIIDTAVLADTFAEPPPPKKKTSTGSKPVPKKTTPTKTEAIKPKKTQTKS